MFKAFLLVAYCSRKTRFKFAYSEMSEWGSSETTSLERRTWNSPLTTGEGFQCASIVTDSRHVLKRRTWGNLLEFVFPEIECEHPGFSVFCCCNLTWKHCCLRHSSSWWMEHFCDLLRVFTYTYLCLFLLNLCCRLFLHGPRSQYFPKFHIYIYQPIPVAKPCQFGHHVPCHFLFWEVYRLQREKASKAWQYCKTHW